MRIPPNGRGIPAKVRTSSLRYWMLDDDDPTVALDIVGGDDMSGPLGGNSAPSILMGPTGFARRFDADESLRGANVGTDDAEMRGDWVVHALFMPMSVTAAGVIAAYSGASDLETSPENALMSMRITAAGKAEMFWENGAGTDVTFTSTDFVFQLHKYYIVTWRKSGSTGEGPAGTCDLDLVINGRFIERFASVQNSADGRGSRWTLGSEFNSGGAGTSMVDGLVGYVAVYDDHLMDDPTTFVLAQPETHQLDEIREDVRRLLQLPFYGRLDAKIEVVDGDGLRRDLTNLAGIDWLDEASINWTVENAPITGSMKLLLEHEKLSLAPLRTDSNLNLTDVTDPTSYAPLVFKNRVMEVFVARVPLGIAADPGDWWSLLLGRIDEVKPSGDRITVSFRDFFSSWLLQSQMETEYEYGGEPPVLVTGEMQALLDDNDNAVNGVSNLPARFGAYDPITLKVIGSITRGVIPWRQRKEKVLAAMKTLARSTAGDLRSIYDQDPDDPGHKLTFYIPLRDRVDADFFLGPDDIIDMREAKISGKDQRSVDRIAYPGSEATVSIPSVPAGFTVEEVGAEGVDSEGQRLPAFITVRHDQSVADDGRSFMELSEASVSQIDKQAEALAMCLGCLNDVRDPSFTHSIDLSALPEMEVQDMAVFLPGHVYTVEQPLAAFTHNLRIGPKAMSALTTRGRPSAGFKGWVRLEAQPFVRPPATSANAQFAELGVGRRLEYVRNLTERTSQLRAGRVIELQGGDFSQATRGPNYFPDGWNGADGVTGGTAVWDTDISAVIGGPNTLSGGRAIFFNDFDKTMDTVFHQMQGSIDGTRQLPYRVEMAQARTGVVGTQRFEVFTRWYDAAKAFISEQAELFPLFSEAIGIYEIRRGALRTPPTDARFFVIRIQARQIVAPYVPIVLDRVAMVRISQETRATLSELSQPPATDPGVGQRGLPDNPGGGAFTLIELNDVSTGEAHDYGGQFVLGTHSIDVAEDGLYNIKAKVSFTVQDNLNDAPDWGVMRININGVEWKRGQAGVKDHVPAGQEMIHSEIDDEIQLNKDDSLTISTYIKGAVGQALSGANMTFLFLKLISSE